MIQTESPHSRDTVHPAGAFDRLRAPPLLLLAYVVDEIRLRLPLLLRLGVNLHLSTALSPHGCRWELSRGVCVLRSECAEVQRVEGVSLSWVRPLPVA